MSKQTWQETVKTGIDVGISLSAAATSSLLASQQVYTLPAHMWEVGTAIRIRATGKMSNAITTPGTGLFQVVLTDAASTPITVWDSGAFDLNLVAKTDVPWWIEIELVCAQSDSQAALFGMGKFTCESVVGSPVTTVGGVGTLLLPVSSPANGSGFDPASTEAVDLTWTQTESTGAIQLMSFVLEVLN